MLKYLRTFVFIYLASIFYLAACAPSTGKNESNLPEMAYADELQNALDQVIQSNQSKAPLGISAAVIASGYQPWTGVSGDSHPGVPLTPDMLFDAGSIAKTFEAALTMKLAEAGRLSLEAPISNYLPDYTHVDGAITIRQLLDHSSGVFNVFEHPDFPWVGANVDYSKRWLIEEVISQFVLEPYGPPGAFQHYSSTNYLLLTAIIEEVTGSSVPAEIERQLLIPLDLQQIFVSMGEAPELEHPVAHPWIDTNGDGTLEDLHGIPLTWKATLTHPVLFSTASDLARWMQTLHHDRTVLEPDSYKEMLTFPEVQTLDPEGGLYGLGIVDFSAMLGEEVIGHGGSSLGYSAAALYLPEYGVSIAWLVNTGENPGDLADQIMLDAWLSLSEIISVNQVSLP